MKNFFKEFKPTSWSINNKTSIYIITVIITFFGITAYNDLPKESFPEIVIPTVYVSTVYPGTSPGDIENLVTRPIEKEIKSISGVRKISSNSLQDYSSVIVEFNTDVDPSVAKQKVKDAVDKARPELPSDLPNEPTVMEVDFSEMPIMLINLSGDYHLDKLKNYAEDLQDKIEQMKEITRVDIVGALEREIQVNVDMYRMDAATVSMGDIENAISFENMTVSGGNIDMGNMKRSVRIQGEFTSVDQLKNIVVKSAEGAPIYLKDIAEVKDSYKERESYARLNNKNVLTLNVIKRSGENLVIASDNINKIIAEMKKTTLPADLSVHIMADQSKHTKDTLQELINTIIIGFILVTIVLMFFMGVTNAIFVGLAVPLSSLIAFMIMPAFGMTLNMIVLFSFLFALGIIVDDAIVVIENTYRIFEKGKVPINTAAKRAAGEIFIPVLAGTLTTLAPFFPLLFWPGVVGKFMHFLPLTLIITLIASLVVAFIINPVFAVSFMKPEQDQSKKYKGLIISGIVFGALALIFYIFGSPGLGNLAILFFLLLLLNRFILRRLIAGFDKKVMPRMMNGYERMISRAIKGYTPYLLLLSTVLLLGFSVLFAWWRQPPVVFFPKSDPNYIYVYLEMPVGTSAAVTDSVTKIIENRVFNVIGDTNKIVDAVVSNVAVGAGDPMDGDRSISPHKGKVTVAFVEYPKRKGEKTTDYLDKIREAVKDIPGTEITVDQEQGGPPTGKPINIEISGDDFRELIALSGYVKNYLDSLQIPGVEELKSNLQDSKPEIIINIDRERASREGISTGQVGAAVRNAIYGKEVSKFRVNEDQYPIQLRYGYEQRNNIDALLNTRITFRDMAAGGMIRQIPLSSLASIEYTNSYGAINRKDLKRTVTISSNILTGYNPNEVVDNLQKAVKNIPAKEGYEINFTGESEDQQESMEFLTFALFIALGLIFIILVTQFNSLSKPLIILSEIVFSIIGVLLGFSLFKMDISIVMTGIGIVALSGIVVKNGILLVEFTDKLIARGEKTRNAIIQAGKIRMKPVILTALSTILGLIPLAVGFNINFATLFSELNPQIYFGGDSVAFWKPLSWTIIFGLGFATLITLILVPAMYLIAHKARLKFKRMMFKPSLNGMGTREEVKENEVYAEI
jgi:multidrug efflux pump